MVVVEVEVIYLQASGIKYATNEPVCAKDPLPEQWQINPPTGHFWLLPMFGPALKHKSGVPGAAGSQFWG